MPRWSSDKTRCNGKADPTAPHDLTLPDALTPDGKCRACKRYSNRAQKKRTRGTSVPIEEIEAVARAAEPVEVTVWPRNTRTAETGARWQHAQEDREARAVFSELFDEWELPPSYVHLPGELEDWYGMEDEKAEKSQEWRDHRVALARLANDTSQSMYNRRLAWQALTDARRTAK